MQQIVGTWKRGRAQMFGDFFKQFIDITEGLKSLWRRKLIFVGDRSPFPFHCEALHMASKLDRRYSALVEVQACGSMVTEEQPHAILLIPMEYFFMGYGLYMPCHFNESPRSPLSPSFISPELLSPESMGLKLKTNQKRCFTWIIYNMAERKNSDGNTSK